MRTAELQLVLKPNRGWTVNIIRDGRNEGPTHSGYFSSKGEAQAEAQRSAARMLKRGTEARVLGEHVTIWI